MELNLDSIKISVYTNFTADKTNILFKYLHIYHEIMNDQSIIS